MRIPEGLLRPLSPKSALFWPALLAWLWAVRYLYWRTVAPVIEAAVGPYESTAPAVLSRHGVDLSFLPLPTLFQLLLVVAALRLSGLTEADIRWRLPPSGAGRWALAGAAIGAAEFAAITILTGHGAQLFSWTASGPREALSALLGAAYVFEELACRGVVYVLLKERLGLWPAVILSSAAFTAGHFTAGDMLAPFGVVYGEPGGYPISQVWYFMVGGGLYCLLTERSGWLGTAIIMHGVHNVLMSLHT